MAAKVRLVVFQKRVTWVFRFCTSVLGPRAKDRVNALKEQCDKMTAAGEKGVYPDHEAAKAADGRAKKPAAEKKA